MNKMVKKRLSDLTLLHVNTHIDILTYYLANN